MFTPSMWWTWILTLNIKIENKELTLNEYKQLALETAIYPNGLYHDSELGLINRNN